MTVNEHRRAEHSRGEHADNEPSNTAMTAAAARAAHLIVDQSPVIFADTCAAALLGERADELIGYHRQHAAHPILASCTGPGHLPQPVRRGSSRRRGGGWRAAVRRAGRGPGHLRVPVAAGRPGPRLRGRPSRHTGLEAVRHRGGSARRVRGTSSSSPPIWPPTRWRARCVRQASTSASLQSSAGSASRCTSTGPAIGRDARRPGRLRAGHANSSPTTCFRRRCATRQATSTSR